jgi:osmotically-inducible protein OsmY
VLKRTLTVFITELVIMESSSCNRASNDRSRGKVIYDTVIVSTIKTKLLVDSDVSGFDTDVDSYKGDVSLSGTVNTETESAKGTDIARDVNSIISVKDNLAVNLSQNDAEDINNGK